MQAEMGLVFSSGTSKTLSATGHQVRRDQTIQPNESTVRRRKLPSEHEVREIGHGRRASRFATRE